MFLQTQRRWPIHAYSQADIPQVAEITVGDPVSPSPVRCVRRRVIQCAIEEVTVSLQSITLAATTANIETGVAATSSAVNDVLRVCLKPSLTLFLALSHTYKTESICVVNHDSVGSEVLHFVPVLQPMNQMWRFAGQSMVIRPP